jgi:hypothetical protein
MKNLSNTWPMLAVLAFFLVFSLAGCAAGGMQEGAQTHLSASQCRDLTALRNNAPITHERNMSEVAALEKAGYRPTWGFDPYYPEDLQTAQLQVERWYQAECQQTRPD